MARTHKSMRGVPIDMERTRNQNANQVALGNAKMNARGDVLGANGQVVMTREQLLSEYNKKDPRAVKQVSVSDKAPLPDHFITPEQMIKRVQEQAKNAQAAQQVAQQTTVQQSPFTAGDQPKVARAAIQVPDTYVPVPTTSQKLGEETNVVPTKPARNKRVMVDKED
jgi:osmotically-inducible protein OsmY